ncbi:3-oxoacyl-[acyl-carrier-protein] reductase [Brevibacillus laterosporus]|uniref:3-oxoacyl-[acyl-carrier-protein] reductase n=1 Tax=Brevibacillus laterosporus TaxID=1465 RepID=UPI0015E2040A|nr:3-oxoacyl-[acyl-carrier-protein] reductase [Brevibacillus laterosporus]MED1664625.1 3-oxoacyl-[acyl-carrier-protein] reductase [Brevibacillus laterosporus]MED1670060.1 3-oxoacyl-[acyl-carrier-protein] reductase [Brevibacillus laterosporus]MED1718991.1 3-oxoacyl-[acyl-carrier-protein] reductase [Brevibacillus laterosporus]
MLEDKVALITGASRGIGRAIALKYAEAGANIIVNYSGNEAKAQETVADIEKLGREAIMIRANVGNTEEAENMVKEALERFGKIDILVNNAGITRDNLLMRMKESEWDEVINVNLKGVFNMTKALTRPMMKQRGGSIINITSVVGVLGNAGQANYVAAKAGVIGLTKTTARELASRNIKVNAIAPGFVDTDMTDVLPEDVKSGILAQIPFNRLGSADEISNVALFLASDASSYMTGQTLHVDGGMYM